MQVSLLKGATELAALLPDAFRPDSLLKKEEGEGGEEK